MEMSQAELIAALKTSILHSIEEIIMWIQMVETKIPLMDQKLDTALEAMETVVMLQMMEIIVALVDQVLLKEDHLQICLVQMCQGTLPQTNLQARV